MRIKSFVDSHFVAWASHDVEKIISYFTDEYVYEDFAFGVVNCGREEQLQILITEFLISVYAFVSMHAKALTCTCAASMSLTSVNGLTVR
jgi:hypothetical protein